MAAFYHDFTSARVTEPDPATLLAQLRALDASAGVQHDQGRPDYRLKKSTDWLPAHITAAQTVIDTAPASTPQLSAQAEIDRLPIATKALLLTLLDELNLLREWTVSFKAATAAATSLANLQARVAALPDLPDRTPTQAIAAVRAKAGTL